MEGKGGVSDDVIFLRDSPTTKDVLILTDDVFECNHLISLKLDPLDWFIFGKAHSHHVESRDYVVCNFMSM